MSREDCPSLFHIGTQKAGSTFFYNALAGNPDLDLSRLTEINYFTKNYDQGMKWYLDQFKGKGIKIDTSPKYFMLAEVAAPRIKEYEKAYLVEPIKFLLILRNPIDYLLSHYEMQKIQSPNKDNKNLSLLEYSKKNPGYLERARYYKKMMVWLKYFDIKQFKVICFEDFVKNKKEVFAEILKFWEIESPVSTPEKTSQNKRLRSRWLWQARRRIVRHEKIKHELKQSRLFNWLYDNIFTVKKELGISKEDRQYLLDQLMPDIRMFKELYPNKFNSWEL